MRKDAPKGAANSDTRDERKSASSVEAKHDTNAETKQGSVKMLAKEQQAGQTHYILRCVWFVIPRRDVLRC